jgi:transcriptional regulator
MQIETWSVVYTSKIMSIGCQQHKICEWWKFTDEQISAMDNKALSWWKKWKPILQQIIEISPAVDRSKEDK